MFKIKAKPLENLESGFKFSEDVLYFLRYKTAKMSIFLAFSELEGSDCCWFVAGLVKIEPRVFVESFL